MTEQRTHPRYLNLVLLNRDRGRVDLDANPQLLARPVSEAFDEALRLAAGMPEAGFRPRAAEHDVVIQPSGAYAQPVFDLSRTLGEALDQLQGDEVEVRVSTSSRQGACAAGGE